MQWQRAFWIWSSITINDGVPYYTSLHHCILARKLYCNGVRLLEVSYCMTTAVKPYTYPKTLMSWDIGWSWIKEEKTAEKGVILLTQWISLLALLDWATRVNKEKVPMSTAVSELSYQQSPGLSPKGLGGGAQGTADLLWNHPLLA